MLWSDSREMWKGTTMPDARVLHFWDGEQIDGYEGVAWDTYYLFGPEATWETVPSSLVSSGGTIYGERQALEMQMHTLLTK